MSPGSDSAKRALIAIRELRARVNALETERAEPIAIIGMGCRFPGGADSPESFWRLLRDGVDAVIEVPRNRWNVDAYYDPDPSAPGKMVTRWGGFVDGIDRFDPAFFGVSPREAASIDPQQRLLLEVAWEALDDAGVAPGRIAGTRTGVFVGIYNNDYAQLQLSTGAADAHAALGSSLGVAPGRLSYLLDVSGPSLVIDTLCSSSLVALHLACESLRAQECNLAIVAAVNLILSPLSTILTSRLLALAPDGRCKTFDARANGFVRGEGCGAVVLKRLSDALADGDPIWAVVRGSAVNQDGRSTGLTAPNARAQQAVIAQALARGRVDPQEVGYIEAHGTGTPLGDPIEVDALRAVFGRPNGSAPTIALGSVKTNLGHLEAAAGMAGLMKAVLAVRHGVIPPHLHLRQLNPRIALEGTPFVIPTAAAEWPGGDRRRVAGVSSFGMSGTNAHVVIEQGPPRAAAPAVNRPFLLPLSARTDPALRELTGRYATYLNSQPEAGFAQVCYTAQTGRDAFEHRIAVVADDAATAVARLDAAIPSRRRQSPKLAFLFTGQGAQYAGMGRALVDTEPVFRAALDRCAAVLRPLIDVPLESLLFDSTERLHQTGYTQAALFALEWSLAQVWLAWGVKAEYVLGHSVGEYVAACVAGAFSLADGLTLAARRGRLMQSLPHDGAMASIQAAESEVAAAIEAGGYAVSIAAVNAPKRTVVSGLREAVDALCAEFPGTRRLNVSHAFHSELMAPILDEFESTAAQLDMRPLTVPLVSNVTGGALPAGATLDAAYWRRQLRQTVQFERGMNTLAASGCNVFLEIGPHPVLTPLGQQCLESDAAWISSLRQGQGDRTVMLEGLGRLWTAGLNPDWEKLYQGRMTHRSSLPTYPFQRERCWMAHSSTLLGSRVHLATAEAAFESHLSIEALPWVRDHRVQGEGVLPAAAILSLARQASTHGRCVVSDVVFREPLIVPERSPVTTQFILAPDGPFKLCSLDGTRWRVHAEGVVHAGDGEPENDGFDTIRQHCRDEVAPEEFYAALGAQGLTCGPQFRSLRQIWRDGMHAVARVGPVDGEPSVLDACLQLLGLTLFLDRPGTLYLPFSVARVEWHGEVAAAAWAHARLGTAATGDVDLYDADGRLVLAMRGVAFAAAATAAAARVEPIAWEAQPLPAPAGARAPESWVVVGDAGELARRLAALGHTVRTLARESEFRAVDLRSDGLVYVAAADEPLDAPLRLTQAVLAQGAAPRLWWVTHGALEQQPLAGFGLTLAREHPELASTVIDLEPALPASASAPALLACLWAERPLGARLRLRGGLLHTPRPTRGAADLVPARVAASESGELDRVQLAPLTRRAPGPGEVEIRVEAAGLNFRDVLQALGVIAPAPEGLGGECAGRVAAVGAGVTHVTVGDRVAALAAGSLATHVTVAGALTVRIPDALATVDAATLPIAFLTVRYALSEIGRLQPGERVLVHSAAGGVGLAAVQWARAVGARVYATAGSAHKRALLEALGVTVIGSSRDLPAESAVEVDVVLNALSGAAIEWSLRRLAPGGRFLELGKRNIWTSAQVAALRPDVTYVVVDLQEQVAAAPETVGRWLAELMASVTASLGGLLRPLPVQTLPLADAAQALKRMAQGQHVGKLALVSPIAEPLRVRPEGRYLITGGTGAVGQALARWLVAQGARQLILAARTAPATPVAIAGATVTVLSLDVTDETALQALPPVDGIIHAAGVLDDGLLVTQTPARVAAVLAPKVAGARALHRLTAGRPLDFFVLCSSAAALWGSPGQAAYAAANAYLDALAEQRRALGHPALSVNLGPVAEAGMAARTPGAAAAWAAAGIGLLPLAAVGPALLEASHTGAAQVLAMRPAEEASRPERPAPAAAPRSVARSASVADAVRHAVAHVLGLGQVPDDRPLGELGLDSLLAVELRNRLARELDRPLPATLAFDYPTVAAMIGYLEGTTPTAAPLAPAPDAAIAIIGMGCRMPGAADSPEQLWRLLAGGIDAIGETPRERWDIDAYYDPDPAAPGKMSTRWGGFLDGIDRFDAAFFGIAPREAVSMDPQHRLLLEVSWEALERAGLAPGRLAGSPTGVFIGISTNDYSQLQMKSGDPTAINPYFGTGSAVSVAAGRLSYVLGLQGPAMAVDTACSSSLTAVHLACQSLRNGECSLALAGGVNAILTPEATINFSQAQMMAPDGRCKTFDAAADGYVRSEGCGVVVLKRLSDALRDADPVLAVVRGSAVNQDGRSTGLTAPNGPAQETLVRTALQRAGVLPGAVGYVEAHGTGTALGDPIELQALGAVLADGRPPDRPVLVGSVKTNLGHLEAAAGMAGLLKATLAVQHGQIPPSLHFQTPSPLIPWADLPLRVPTQLTPWPEGHATRIAGVSAFGVSGTNAHVVIEQAPERAWTAPATDRPCHVLALSAKTPDALRDLMRSYTASLSAASFPDVCHTANTGRSHFFHRVGIVAATAEEARAKLERARPVAAEAPPKIAFLFAGQGTQYAGMGRPLYEHQPVFHAVLDRCAAIVEPWLDVPLLDVLFEEGFLDQTRYCQPALVAFEYALAELWQSWGIAPSAVLGHSVGECAAACVAGVLSVEDALRLAVVRGRLAEAARGGAMAAVFAGADEYGAGVAVAARNAPTETVITGERDAVAKVLAELAARGVRSRTLSMDYAFHSQSLDPVLDELEREAASITYRQPALELISCLTGQRDADGDFTTPAYWRRQAREPVQFAAGLRAAQASGCRVFLEIGPGATLASLGQRNDESALWLPSLRPDRGEFAQMLESLAQLYEAGVPVDWAGFDRGYARRRVALPTYPFQRQRFWVRERPTSPAAPQPGSLLGRPLSSPAMESTAWESLIGAGWPRFLDDHRIGGTQVMPAAAFATQALLAAGDRRVELSDFTVSEALIVGEHEQKSVQVILTADGTIRIYSRAAERWTQHASGTLREPTAAVPNLEPAGNIQGRCPESMAGDEFYANALQRQMQFGPAFRQIERLWRGGGEALCRFAAAAADSDARVVGLIDACFQLAASARPIDDSTSIVVPTGFDRLRLHRAPAGDLWGHATAEGKACVFGEAGVVLEIEGVRLRPAPVELLRPVAAGQCLYEARWQRAVSPAVAVPDGRWLIVADDTGVAAALEALMERGGADCVVARDSGQIGPGHWRGVIDLSALNVTRPEDAGACERTLRTYQALTAADVRAPVWLVTAGSQFVDAAPAPVLPSHAALWGLGRSVAMERPELRGGLIDLDPGVPAGDSAAAVMQEILAADPEPEVAIRGGSRHVARLVTCNDADAAGALRLRSDATYLITGGVGGLGLLVARRFAARGARHMVLLSRNAPGPAAQAAIDALRHEGVHVTTIEADVAREHDLAEALRDISPPLCGLVHAAGVLDDALLPQQTWTKFETVMAPKVAGSWNLHVHTRNLPLDFFVMFSSLSGALGAPAQSNYAAANAFVDALAHYRRAQGLPALSIDWAPWSGVGMAASARGWTARGLSALSPERGLDLLERMLQRPAAQVAVIPADWPQFLAQFPDERSTRIFAALHPEDVLRRPDFRRQLEAAPAARRRELLVAHVREQVAAVLDPDASGELTLSQGFFDLGMDSLMAMEVRNRLQRSVGIALPATIAFEQGTIAALADHLSGVLFPPETVETAAATGDDEGLAALLTEIEALSPDDVERQLIERQGGGGTP